MNVRLRTFYLPTLQTTPSSATKAPPLPPKSVPLPLLLHILTIQLCFAVLKSLNKTYSFQQKARNVSYWCHTNGGRNLENAAALMMSSTKGASSPLFLGGNKPFGLWHLPSRKIKNCSEDKTSHEHRSGLNPHCPTASDSDVMVELLNSYQSPFDRAKTTTTSLARAWVINTQRPISHACALRGFFSISKSSKKSILFVLVFETIDVDDSDPSNNRNSNPLTFEKKEASRESTSGADRQG